MRQRRRSPNLRSRRCELVSRTLRSRRSRSSPGEANVQLDAPESIVVAIPGQAAEEFALNGVPDNAIQIVDDEPQGVPTEEEVDAMLAATATALLTSGLAGEVISGDDVVGRRLPDEIESRQVELAAVCMLSRSSRQSRGAGRVQSCGAGRAPKCGKPGRRSSFLRHHFSLP